MPVILVGRIIAILILIVPSLCGAANIYICRDATGGTYNGNSWSTAYQDWPVDGSGYIISATGSTIYICGSDTPYSYLKFSNHQATSGSQTYVKKCYAGEGTCDSAAGWTASYGTKQAIIPRIQFENQNSYITVTGSYRTSCSSGHGIKLYQNVEEYRASFYTSGTGSDHIKLLYMEMQGIGSYVSGNDAAVYSAQLQDNVEIAYNYMYAMSQQIYTSLSNSTIHDNCLYENIGDHAAAIGLMAGDDVYIYNNDIKDMGNTAYIEQIVALSTNNRVRVYNNVFRQTAAHGHSASRLLEWGGSGTDYAKCVDCLFANNTIYNMIDYTAGTSGVYQASGATSNGASWTIKNNLWYCSGTCQVSNNSPTDTNITMSYDKNWYSGVGYTAGENGAINAGSEDPFTDRASVNLTLKSAATPVDAGASLSSFFTTDILGASRPQGAAWDIGAYEFLLGQTQGIIFQGVQIK